MKRFLLVIGIVLCGIAGAVAGFFSLNARYWIYGPLHKSARYDGFGGPFLALIEWAYAMCAGAVVGGRAAWLAVGLVNRLTGGESISGDRPARIDFVILGVLSVWASLVWASW